MSLFSNKLQQLFTLTWELLIMFIAKASASMNFRMLCFQYILTGLLVGLREYKELT